MTQLETQSLQICVKSYEQTFIGTHFVPQKTCLTRVDKRVFAGSKVSWRQEILRRLPLEFSKTKIGKARDMILNG
jgi:hypothetical protein